jgi:hypothetical protein
MIGNRLLRAGVALAYSWSGSVGTLAALQHNFFWIVAVMIVTVPIVVIHARHWNRRRRPAVLPIAWSRKYESQAYSQN